ncbi:unnamed protein product [Jaminaea pallidilutea]
MTTATVAPQGVPLAAPLASGSKSSKSSDVPQLSAPVLLRTMTPFPKTISMRLPLSTTGEEILSGVSSRLRLSAQSADSLRLYTRNGKVVPSQHRLCDISAGRTDFIDLELRLSVLGGKGGFGSMLRAQGGKMSARKGEENNDACRDLNGRRLKTVKEAQDLAAYMAAAPEREKALSKAQADKYAKLERMLGRKPRSAQEFEEAAGKLDEAGGDLGEGVDDRGEGPSRIVPVKGREATGSGISGGSGSKRFERFDDHKFIQESRDAADKARGAAAMAMAKKKQKQKEKERQQQQQQQQETQDTEKASQSIPAKATTGGAAAVTSADATKSSATVSV